MNGLFMHENLPPHLEINLSSNRDLTPETVDIADSATEIGFDEWPECEVLSLAEL